MLAACVLEQAAPAVEIPKGTDTAEVIDAAEMTATPVVEDQLALTAPPFKHPDTLTLFMGSPHTLDPAWSYAVADVQVESQIYEGLLGFNKDPADALVPILAPVGRLTRPVTAGPFTCAEASPFTPAAPWSLTTSQARYSARCCKTAAAARSGSCWRLFSNFITSKIWLQRSVGSSLLSSYHKRH
jgi:hypothetical protein